MPKNNSKKNNRNNNSNQNNLRRSSRKRKMSPKLKRSLRNPSSECHFIWDTHNNKFINDFNKHKFLCRTNRSGKKMYYKRGYNNKSYNFIGYQNKLDTCIGLANTYGSKKITEEKLCNSKDTQFNNFINVNKYLGNLFTKKNVNNFFKDLMEIIFINTKTNKLTYQETLDNILSGAYCVFSNDNGQVFDTLYKKHKSDIFKDAQHAAGGSDGFSTHFSHGDHYRLGFGTLYDTQGKVSNRFDFIIGRRPILSKWQYKNKPNTNKFEEYQGDTWMQFEAYRMTGLMNKMLHTKSTAQYLYHLKNRNVGPFGTSPYTEMSKPLILNHCGYSNDSNMKSCNLKI
jgi:hypothetical protein